MTETVDERRWQEIRFEDILKGDTILVYRPRGNPRLAISTAHHKEAHPARGRGWVMGWFTDKGQPIVDEHQKTTQPIHVYRDIQGVTP